jgi:hypothetical protein
MTFDRDIHQTTIKNNSFGKSNFSAEGYSIYLSVISFERASQDAVEYEVFDFNSYSLSGEKDS